MSGPQPSPTPQPAPTPTPDVSHVALPDVPSNTYQLLSNLADAIDTANGKFTTHATRLAGVSQETNGAVTNVTSTSQGQAATTLSDTWTSTQTDFNRAHDPLLAITASSCMGGSPNPLWAVLDEHKASIQNGLIAMENIQMLQRSCPLQPPTAAQVEEWIQEVNALTASLGNVNLVLETMILALRNLNGGFTASCATGFTPGMPPPTFPSHVFASTSSGGTGGGGGANLNDFENDLKNKGVAPDVAENLALWTDSEGLSLSDVQKLVDDGVNPEELTNWIESGKVTAANLSDITTLTGQGLDGASISTLINNGADLQATSADVSSVLSKGATTGDVNQWVQKGLNLKYADVLLGKGTSADYITNNLGNYLDPKQGSSNWIRLPKSDVNQALLRWKNGTNIGDNDGGVFANRPQWDSKAGRSVQPFPPPINGTLREYYVDGQSGSQRILVDSSGKAYYYPSHYDPATRIPIPPSYLMQLLGK